MNRNEKRKTSFGCNSYWWVRGRDDAMGRGFFVDPVVLIQLGRKCGMVETAEQVLFQKKSPKGLTSGQTLESFILLSVLGGDCVDDMEHLRQDQGLATMLGYTPPASETARQWLDKFHDEELMLERPLQGSFLPPESKFLAGLKEVNRKVIWAYVAAVNPGLGLTIDVDAQLVETEKANALCCYEGYKAFHPMKASWAETGLVLVDEFREGNVSPTKDIKRIVDEAYQMVPSKKWKVRIRSDSAAYDQNNLDRWQHEGWEFAASADMSPQLRKEIESLPEKAWKIWKEENKDTGCGNGLKCFMYPVRNMRTKMLNLIDT